MLNKIYLLSVLYLCTYGLMAQCANIPGSIFSSATGNESGTIIISNKENEGLFIAGSKNDSMLLMKIDLDGLIVWSKCFEVLAGIEEFVTSILVDDSGMVVLGGITEDQNNGGRIFVVRYDPVNHVIAWINIYHSAPHNLAFNIIQKKNGNYIFLTNPHFYTENHLDTDLFEIDKNSGEVVTDFSKRYTFFGTESLFDLTYDGNFLFGVGRYKDGGLVSDFRNTIAKINPDDGTPVWFKFSHVAAHLPARLYGIQLVEDGDNLISAHYGDPDGTSTTFTDLFLQKTNKDGELVWCHQYDLEGTNVDCHEIIKSGNGYVVLASHLSPEREIIMFKIDAQGSVLWANTYQVNGISNLETSFRARNRLIETDGHLMFTAVGSTDSGNKDIILFRTDLNGNANMPCFSNEPISIPVIELPNVAFYEVFPNHDPNFPTVQKIVSQSKDAGISNSTFCSPKDTIFTFVDAEICDDENFEGYTDPGIYVDTFRLGENCDSIRELTLRVVNCQTVDTNSCLTIGAIYGSQDKDERGYSLASAEDGLNFYMAGVKSDSVIISKMNVSGDIEWSRTIDVVKNKEDHVTAIILDSDGMLAVAGTSANWPSGGSVFLFRYNPVTHQILWSKEYTNAPLNFCFSLIQNGPGGNYIISNSAHFQNSFQADAELTEVDKLTGDIVFPFADLYHVGNEDDLTDLYYDQGFVYGYGRFTEGANTSTMRSCMVKINSNSGALVWSKAGHVDQVMSARLYGRDVIVDNGYTYSVSHGSPTGTSLSNIQLFVQKTNVDGDLIWVNQYELPDDVDIGYEIIKSGNGYVIYAHKRFSDQYLVLFKIDPDGALLWANEYQFEQSINSSISHRAKSQLIQVGNHLVFTAFTTDAQGNEDLVVVRTDLTGQTDIPCVSQAPTSVQVKPVPDAVLFDQIPEGRNVSPNHSNAVSTLKSGTLALRNDCIIQHTLHSVVDTIICLGTQYEGYEIPGMYVDTLTSVFGCDSIRSLNLQTRLDEFALAIDLCSGESFEGYSEAGVYIDTIYGEQGSCDSLRLLTISALPALETFVNASVCEGTIVHGYSETGYYVDTLTAINGCDSLSILDLTVYDTVVNAISHQICTGDTYMGHTTTGIYSETYLNTFGCDSTVVLTLTVAEELNTLNEVTICLGDEYEGNSTPGTYRDTLLSGFGCDSIVITELEVEAIENSISASICDGESFENYNTGGFYTDTIQAVMGSCDTIRFLTLAVIPDIFHEISHSLCEGDNYFGYATDGIYTDTLLSQSGCDSIRTVFLTLVPTPSVQLQAKACDGFDYGYTEPGTYIDTLISVNGCDSIRTLILQSEPMFIPNVISPNDDGVNDEFRIFTPDDRPLNISYFGIFDRFGNMCYETFEWPVIWYGKGKNEAYFNPGVFTYVLTYICNERRIIKTGDITLIR